MSMPTNSRQHPRRRAQRKCQKSGKSLINQAGLTEKAKRGSCLLLECLQAANVERAGLYD